MVRDVQAVNVRLEGCIAPGSGVSYGVSEKPGRLLDYSDLNSAARHTERNYRIGMLKLWYTMVHVYKTHVECICVNHMEINSTQPSFKKMIDWSNILHIGQKAILLISFRLNEK